MQKTSFNDSLITTLQYLKNEIGIPTLLIQNSEVILASGKTSLLTITSSDMLLGKTKIQQKLNNSSKEDPKIKGDFSKFVQAVGDKIVRLNHLGISYFSDDVESEIEEIKKITKKENLPLFIEDSDDASMQWLFTGDTTEWQNPLFEIVLNKKSNTDNDYWRPHFQIDFDTTLSIEELAELSDRYLENDFFKWHLSIPTIGTVLAMGILGEAQGIKIALGMGTSLRRADMQRKSLIQIS